MKLSKGYFNEVIFNFIFLVILSSGNASETRCEVRMKDDSQLTLVNLMKIQYSTCVRLIWLLYLSRIEKI